MGATVSTSNGNNERLKKVKSDDEGTVSMQSSNIDVMISLVMPLYYSKASLTHDEKEAASYAWKLIIGNRSPHFLEMKEEMEREGKPFPYTLCADYFSDIFYARLFDTHPDCKGLFANSKMKMRINFMGVITLLLGAMEEDKDKFVKTLQGLARVHNIIGVKAVEYGLGCEILMYAMMKCVGPVIWSSAASRGWAKIFSRVLDEIIPVVVRFELENRSQSADILAKRQLSQQEAMHVISPNGLSTRNREM